MTCLLVQAPAAKAEGGFAGEDVARDEESICVISADLWRGRYLLTQTMVDRVERSFDLRPRRLAG